MRLTTSAIAILFVAAMPAAQDAARAAQESPPESRVERVEIPSVATAGEVPAMVYLPPGYFDDDEQRYPVIYFLHGAGRGNERTWQARGSDRVVDQLTEEGVLPPSIVVCPRAPRSMCFYINWKGQEDQRHGDFVTAELPAFVDAHYRTVAKRGHRALMGDSMGGFGALIDALHHPEVFGCVAVHSPSIYPEDIDSLPGWMRGGGRGRGRGNLLAKIFGDPIDNDWWLDNNAFHLAKTAEPDQYDDLAIYFDVGREDRYGLAKPCQMWHELLDESGIAHKFVLRDGSHGREYFSANVPHSLAFVGEVLRRAAGEDK